MTTIQCCKSVIAIATLFAASGTFAATMSKADYATGKDRIGADYKVDKAACDSSSGNAKDICKEQAKGKEKIALAELEYQYSGLGGDGNKLAVAKADAAFAIAKEVCDDKAGNPKDVCRAEAKAAHVKALADAKLVNKVGAATKNAAEDKRDADYKVVAEKCDSLAGEAKSSCISAAKVRFNKS
ncbi:hypothetical protein FNU76_17135 [Chitinimonas arctica]|uniref:DUF4189 domain-containing protein n=1 Tax=Chitinimonas arctica TaxID=2594795 RepID=A0A516SIR2_9NEIS|nr:hypothetical protein [Chitinimonas arctica]QDQ27928.1 hypothetical protein FNU76_17135 [Chitinimonas arctica]